MNRLPLFALLLLTACTVTPSLKERLVREPTPSQFTLCYEDACESSTTAGLSAEEWQQIALLFRTVTNADTERRATAQAIGLFQKSAYLTMRDIYRDNSRFQDATGGKPAMDFTDVAVNTSTYLHILRNSGFLKYHKPTDIIARGIGWAGPSHQAATITDVTNNQVFAVDGWYMRPGLPADVTPAALWKSGWLGF